MFDKKSEKFVLARVGNQDVLYHLRQEAGKPNLWYVDGKTQVGESGIEGAIEAQLGYDVINWVTDGSNTRAIKAKKARVIDVAESVDLDQRLELVPYEIEVMGHDGKAITSGKAIVFLENSYKASKEGSQRVYVGNMPLASPSSTGFHKMYKIEQSLFCMDSLKGYGEPIFPPLEGTYAPLDMGGKWMEPIDPPLFDKEDLKNLIKKTPEDYRIIFKQYLKGPDEQHH